MKAFLDWIFSFITIIFVFGPGGKIVSEDFFRWFIVSDSKPDPWTSTFLEPYLVNVSFEVFTSLREWLSYFKASESCSMIPSISDDRAVDVLQFAEDVLLLRSRSVALNLGETDFKERLVFLVRFEVSFLGDWIAFGMRNKDRIEGMGCGLWRLGV